ncbi:MAG: ATP-binding protein [Bacteroidia bacterium]|nr:ATP-binding protein [Bacteroidia bacterium]
MEKILFIDDQPSILQMLDRRFSKLDFVVLTAETTQKAKAILSQQDIDLVVVDYMMPSSGGFEFLEETLHLDVPVIMMTAHSSLHLAIEFIKHGGADFVEKPIDIDVLSVKIRRAIKARRSLTAEKTERAKVEAELRRINEDLLIKTQKLEVANRQLDLYTSSISHDLRSPLRQISSFAQLIYKKNHQHFDEDSHEYFRYIKQATQKMNDLIQGLLTFTKISETNLVLTQVPLQPLIQDVISELRLEKAFHGTIRLESGNLAVLADPLPLRQVLVNLLGNAIKFSSKNEMPEITVFSQVIAGEKVAITITDNGVGFDDQYSGTLFNMFTRLHEQHEFEGIGVGLALVKGIVEKLGGDIWARSEVGQGASFTFILPLANQYS